MAQAPDGSLLKQGQYEALLALARTLIPIGHRIPGANQRTIATLEDLLRGASPSAPKRLGQFCALIDRAAVLTRGRRFSRLSAPDQQALLHRWMGNPIMRTPLSLLGMLLKTAHFDHPEVFRAVGYQYEKGGPAEPARWLDQVHPGEAWEDGEELECDVVVIGTGAGGGVVGKELAERGHAVVFVEEGALHRRDAFTGGVREAHERFYRRQGGIFALGNNAVPVLMGRMVGGSTAINTGVSYRTPDFVLNEWCERYGTDEFSPANMDAHFRTVERELQVEPVAEQFLQGVSRVVARGCDALGWHHYTLLRNAPDCNGQGVCDLGCPSGARRSTDISYIPKALERGGVLFTRMRAERVMLEDGRARGLIARSTVNGRTLRVRSRAVILAGGSVPTPMFLQAQGLANSSGQVGRNLAIQPSTGCAGVFADKLEGEQFVPNTRACDEFLESGGFLLQSGQGSLNLMPIQIPLVGRKFMDLMDRFDQIAGFGVLCRDTGRTGRVGRGPGDKPRVRYWLTADDVRKLKDGMTRCAEMWFAAGAESCLPTSFRFPQIKDADDLERFRKAEFKPWDFMLTSWHPLGTCEIGSDPKKSVVSLDHECHDVPGLFITDGSTVPGAIGVNPQITIMAMATRAALGIDERLRRQVL